MSAEIVLNFSEFYKFSITRLQIIYIIKKKKKRKGKPVSQKVKLYIQHFVVFYRFFSSIIKIDFYFQGSYNAVRVFFFFF